jgi:hypothetical protein
MLTPRTFVAAQAQGKLGTMPGHANDIARDIRFDDQRLGNPGHMSQEMSGVEHGELPTAAYVDLVLNTLELLVAMHPFVTAA